MFYKKLTRQNEFRVLELDRGTKDQPISCRLHHKLLGSFTYEALSYTWNGPRSDTIQCDQFPFQVTENLKDALYQLRSPENSRFLWVDQICINQDDDIEKETHQLPLMSSIYETSSIVWIWLGKSEGAVGMGLDYFSSMMNDHLSSCPDDDPRLAQWRSGDSDRLNAIYSFLNRPWFKRVWTLQEAAMAKTATVLYGEHCVPWSLVQMFNDLCQTDVTGRWTLTQLAISSATDEKTGEFGRYYTAQLLTISKLKKVLETGDRTAIVDVELLRNTRSCGATHVKDKVLSLERFLSDELQVGLQRLNHGLHLSSQELYREVAAILLESHCMNVLGESGLCQRSNEHRGSPSWVPDWTIADSTHSLYMLSDRAALQTGRRLFRATGDSEPQTKITNASRYLTVNGKVLDEICQVAERQRFSIQTDHGPKQPGATFADSVAMAVRLMKERSKMIHASVQLADDKSCRQRYGKDYPAACYQSLFRGIIKQGGGSNVGGVDRRAGDSELIVQFDKFFKAYESLIKPHLLKAAQEMSLIYDKMERNAASAMDLERFGILGLETACMADFTPGSPAWTVIEHVQDSFKGRTFWVAQSGWMGLGPSTGLAQIRAGDKIGVVYGCCTPFVIRPVKTGSGEETYELIGEAYVHGLMDGEALDLDVPDQEIVLV